MIQFLEKIEAAIREYEMLNKKLPVVVAYSGGKDSLFALLMLCVMGYDVRPVVVSRGDAAFHGQEIAQVLKRRYDLQVEILNLRDQKGLERVGVTASELRDISAYLRRVDNISRGESMCAPCYNARTIALKARTRTLDTDVIVTGHHMTDMVTSFLKCYWTETFYTQYKCPFDGYTMRNFINDEPIDLAYLTAMVRKGRAATDEPPVENLGDGIRQVRPLIFMSEHDIAPLAKKYPEVRLSGCSWKNKSTLFRLLVQQDLEKRVGANPGLEEQLFQLALENINGDGTLKCRPRNQRDVWYPGFKPHIPKI